MGADNQLGVDVVGGKLEDAFVVMARTNGIAQGGEPGTLDECSVEGELSASDASGVEGIDVVGVFLETRIFQFESAIDELFDLLFGFGIGRTVALRDKAVIGVLARVQRAHTIQFTEDERGDQVIDGKRIAGMPVHYFLEILNRLVVFEVVEGVERFFVERINRAKDQAGPGGRRGFPLGGEREGRVEAEENKKGREKPPRW